MKGDPGHPADWQKLTLADLARARKATGEGDSTGRSTAAKLGLQPEAGALSSHHGADSGGTLTHAS